MASERVLITGASSGIGAALAHQYAQRGAKVVLVARPSERLQSVTTAVHGIAFPGDVADPVVIANAVTYAQDTLEGLDVVIANAGYALRGDLSDLTMADIRRQFETNVFGVLTTIQATLPLLRATRGRLVIIGSVAGSVTTRGAIAYAMSKAALRPVAEGLRLELAGSGVSVTLITPGLIVSDIDHRDHFGALIPGLAPTPSRWAMPTSDAARKIVRAIDRRRTEAVITWHAWFLLLAWHWCPCLVRPFLAHDRSRHDRSRHDPSRHSHGT